MIHPIAGISPSPFAAKQIPSGDKGESKRSGEGAPGMGVGNVTPQCAILTLSNLHTRRALLTFPFKGKAGMGMGKMEMGKLTV